MYFEILQCNDCMGSDNTVTQHHIHDTGYVSDLDECTNFKWVKNYSKTAKTVVQTRRQCRVRHDKREGTKVKLSIVVVM